MHPGPEWLDAKAIAARTGGQREVGTVRSWWSKKDNPLAYQVFETLSPKSNKRSRVDVVDAYLVSMGIRPYVAAGEGAHGGGAAQQSVDFGTQNLPGYPRLDDVLDALSSVKESADAALELLIADAESRTAAYRTLRGMLHRYDMAMTVLVRPNTAPPGVAGPVV